VIVINLTIVGIQNISKKKEHDYNPKISKQKRLFINDQYVVISILESNDIFKV